MSSSYQKLDQALNDLIEAFAELESQFEGKAASDEDFNTAVFEALETSIENALDEQDIGAGDFANILSALSEALETIDPSAFEEEDEEGEDEEDEDEDPEFDDDDESYIEDDESEE